MRFITYPQIKRPVYFFTTHFNIGQSLSTEVYMNTEWYVILKEDHRKQNPLDFVNINVRES